MKNFLPLCLFLLLAACGGQLEYRDVEGLRFVTLQKVDGREYEVGRVEGSASLFYVLTHDGAPGDREQMIRAARMTFRCENHRVVSQEDPLVSLQLRGLFCPNTGGVKPKD